jgi:hypothetical protein
MPDPTLCGCSRRRWHDTAPVPLAALDLPAAAKAEAGRLTCGGFTIRRSGNHRRWLSFDRRISLLNLRAALAPAGAAFFV